MPKNTKVRIFIIVYLFKIYTLGIYRLSIAIMIQYIFKLMIHSLSLKVLHCQCNMHPSQMEIKETTTTELPIMLARNLTQDKMRFRFTLLSKTSEFCSLDFIKTTEDFLK